MALFEESAGVRWSDTFRFIALVCLIFIVVSCHFLSVFYEIVIFPVSFVDVVTSVVVVSSEPNYRSGMLVDSLLCQLSDNVIIIMLIMTVVVMIDCGNARLL